MTSDTTPAKRPTPTERYTEAVTQAAGTAHTGFLQAYGEAVGRAVTVAYVQMVGDALSEAISVAYQEAMQPSIEAYAETFVAIGEALQRRRSR